MRNELGLHEGNSYSKTSRKTNGFTFYVMTSAKVYTATIPRIDSDRIYEGLRIPPSLDNTTSVNFVLTQEPGKLKPKDLKIAIEKNRAERELRAVEQKKIRDEGGGAGLLDLRGILSEERLNLIDVISLKAQSTINIDFKVFHN
jgi:hypothetical protein